MSEIFLKLVNMSVVASVLITVVVIARGLLRNAPKWSHCILWALVGIRLLCPFTIESAFSLAPNAQTVSTDAYAKTPQVQTGFAAVDNTANQYLAKYYSEDVTFSAKEPVKNPIQIISYIWLSGAAVLFIYAVISYITIWRKVRECICIDKNIYICDRIKSPFVFGIINPRIYIPSDLKDIQIKNVVAHEKAHIKRLDYLWKPLGYALFCVYWFNPLCWLAYILFCRDIEMACDERVVKDWDIEQKKEYSLVLLSFHVPGKMITACPLAFGEVGVKQRVKGILKLKKPTVWLIAAALFSCVLVAVFFLTSPKKDANEVMKQTAGMGLSDEPQSVNSIVGNTEQEDTATSKQQSDKIREQNETFVEIWAAAFCDRDGGIIEALSSDKVKEKLETEQLLTIDDGTAIFGWSSPWPMWDTSDGNAAGYVISFPEEQNNTASILYYAWTSDPHVTVWKQDITFEEKNGDYQVTDEEIHYFENIVSGQEFDEAYPKINNTPMDYSVNGFGAALANNSLLSSSMLYQTLHDPVSAAKYLLNLLDNENKVKIEVIENQSSEAVPLKITFTEDGAERYIKMVKQNSFGGIWVPQDY